MNDINCSIFSTIKPILKKEEEPTVTDTVREMSPELAKISALVTGQPKPKSTTTTVGSISKNFVFIELFSSTLHWFYGHTTIFSLL